MPAPCSLVLQVYAADRTTVAWDVSTDRAHPAPYLVEPTHYGEQSIDVAKGAATIATVTVGVIDPAMIAGDQDGGWATDRLPTVYGRRCRLRRWISGAWVTIADGPAGEPRMDDSYAAYTFEIRDTRETERKLRAFDGGGTATVLPPGVLNGYGAHGVGDWLIPPSVPVAATFRVGQTPGFPGPTTYFEIDPAPVVVSDAMKEAMAPLAVGEHNGRVLWEFPNVTIQWRVAAGPGAWNVIDDLQLASLDSGAPALFLEHTLPNPDQLWIFLRNGLLTPTIPDEPLNGQAVELLLIYNGPPSDAYPYHIDGLTAGEFLANAYDGIYSGGEPTGIRYDPAALALMTDPVRERVKEPVEDLRDFLEKRIYTPTGYVPALDDELRISPVSQLAPSSTVGLPTITSANTEPRPSWGAGARVINTLRFTYARDYVPTDPDVAVAGDGLAEIEQRFEFIDPASVARHGEQVLEIDGRSFRAISVNGGDPLDDDLTAETGYQLAHARNVRLKGRYANGAPSLAVAVMRAGAEAIRAGSFVSVDLSWMPNPTTLRRGLTGMGQVMSVGELDCAWRELLVEMLPPPPSAITDLVATAVSSSQIDLTWTLPSGATGVKIHRSTTSGFTLGVGNLIITLGEATGFPDTGRTASTAYYYRAIAFNDSGDAAASNEATATTPAPAIAPDLVSVLRTQTEDGDLCAGRTWKHDVGWVTTGANDVEFEIRILVATDSAGTVFNTLASGLTTVSSSIEDQTGVAGNVGGSTSPTIAYRKYRVRLVRKSDGSTIEQMDTSQGTLTYYADACA